MRRIGFVLSALLSATSWPLSGCDSGRSIGPAETSTWDTIQHDIFASNCVSCHRVGTSFARQSGLVLTPDLAYSRLLNSVPRNTAAAQDGLVLLSNEGLAGLFKSYLWEKINAPDQEHFYADHPNYGAMRYRSSRRSIRRSMAFNSAWGLSRLHPSTNARSIFISPSTTPRISSSTASNYPCGRGVTTSFSTSFPTILQPMLFPNRRSTATCATPQVITKTLKDTICSTGGSCSTRFPS